MSWKVIRTNALTKDLLLGLLNGEIGAVQVPQFLNSETCNKAITGTYAHGLDYYENVFPRIGRIGITQFEHRYNPEKKLAYFRKATSAHAARQQVFQESGDLLYKVIDFTREAWEGCCGIAVEENTNQQYYAGLIRVIGKALLHLDWAQLDGPEWTIGKISAQLAWNIYLQMGNSGGTIVIYNRLWREPDEQHIIPGSYGYDPKLVQDVERVELTPQKGDLVFFNSRNFHEVNLTEGDVERITVSSFIGWLQSTQELIFWS